MDRLAFLYREFDGTSVIGVSAVDASFADEERDRLRAGARDDGFEGNEEVNAHYAAVLFANYCFANTTANDCHPLPGFLRGRYKLAQIPVRATV